ncbi:DgyrCDS6206 [Dimorphilus gyrociliatus]|uniref:DgyrCDS6206 n=1 Tax=Dimorphilus gyrociliatus TaxID=2664684 RepID=A0A7I8VQ78_9ANNE|nr:DgyrCDS6206 [Dimorphilus gyrociliatus]
MKRNHKLLDRETKVNGVHSVVPLSTENSGKRLRRSARNGELCLLNNSSNSPGLNGVINQVVDPSSDKLIGNGKKGLRKKNQVNAENESFKKPLRADFIDSNSSKKVQTIQRKRTQNQVQNGKLKNNLDEPDASAYSEKICCKWSNCSCKIEPSELLDHLTKSHVDPQKENNTHICLWKGCKVFEKPSKLQAWLERHVISHVGNRPYKCIVTGCKSTFASYVLLQRHINCHFKEKNGSVSNSSISSSNLCTRDPLRKKKKRRKKLPSCVPVTPLLDFFDEPSVKRINDRLEELANSLDVDLSSSCRPVVKFTCSVIARTFDKQDKEKFLVRWFPDNVFQDEWIAAKDYQSSKDVPIGKLPSNLPNSSPSFPAFYKRQRFRSCKRK